MNPVQVLQRKRDGQPLSTEQVTNFVAGYVDGSVPDYQMAAFAMASFIQGLSTEETAALTDAMLNSGEVLTWEPGRPVVDKHSTGGIGDKVSLILAPLLATCGVRVPMLSGRGLGPTGGTLDKLEAIPGFRTDLSNAELQTIVEEVGCAITGASEAIAPADRKLYALRDVTATVPSIPLITASIMSKKLAEGLDALVLDVKHGRGAFMKTLPEAKALVTSLQQTGERMGVRTRVLLTDMNQPLGRMIGNAVEVEEAIECLTGKGPDDLWTVTKELGIELLLAADPERSRETTGDELEAAVRSEAAISRFRQMVEAQGGDFSLSRPRGTPREVLTERAGFVAEIDNERLGWLVIDLGGGRKVLTDPIDHAVGFEILVRIGDRVETGQPWIRLFQSADASRNEHVLAQLGDVLVLSEEPVTPPPLIVERM